MAESSVFDACVDEGRSGNSVAERDRVELARVGKKEVLKVRSRTYVQEPTTLQPR
jgi:hypothetical protein